MWPQSTVLIAILFSTLSLVSAWQVDQKSCQYDARIENIKDVVKYVMKWPERVDKNLGKNKEVNTYVGRLYNQGDWAKVKDVINSVGKMNQEGTSDPMDPTIFCTLSDRLSDPYEKINPKTGKKTRYYTDKEHNIMVKADDIDKCTSPTGSAKAFTMNWEVNGQKKTFIQLCARWIKMAGQTPLFDFDELKNDVKRINVAANVMRQLDKTPMEIGKFAPFQKTMFHEFVHPYKVHDPQIKDEGKYGWNTLTKIDSKVALNTADSYAFTALGTWMISNWGVTITDKGIVEFADELAKRDQQLGQAWNA